MVFNVIGKDFKWVIRLFCYVNESNGVGDLIKLFILVVGLCGNSNEWFDGKKFLVFCFFCFFCRGCWFMEIDN